LTARGKRGNNEGSIYQRSDGRWVASISLGGGERKSFYGKTRAEVAHALTAALREKDRGVSLSELDERQTVGQYLTSWLETARPTIEPSTFERYELDVRRHLIPALGRIRLTRLSPQHVQLLLAEELSAGLAPRSVRNIRAVLRRALNEALALGLVSRNVAALVRAPKAAHGEMHVYDDAQVRRLLEAAVGEREEALLTLAVTSGIREGELLGLRWRNVNLDGRYLHVQTNLRRLRDRGLVLKDVKTGASRRKVELSDVAVAALRRHRTRQLEERLMLGEEWHDLDLVFPHRVGKPMDATALAGRSYARIVRQAELPYIRFHDLRHTAATLMLLKGVSAKKVSETLGHASVSITLSIYAHVLPSMDRDAAAAMDALFSSPAVSTTMPGKRV
jgi:integrase